MIVLKADVWRPAMCICAAASVIAAGSAPDIASSTEAAHAPVRIGVPIPLSGPFAEAGLDILNGAKLAVSEVNRRGGVLGAPVELVVEDDACDANTGAVVALKLVRAGVSVVAGGYCSGAALPELTVLHRAGIPYVLDASTNPRLTDLGYPEVFRTIGRDDHESLFVADFIANSLHAKRAAVIDDSSTHAKTLAESSVAALSGEGVSVVFRDAVTPGQEDYLPTLRRVALQHPDVLYYTGYFPEAARLVKQARSLGMALTFMGGGAANDPMLMKLGGMAVEGMIVTSEPLPAFMPSARRFIQDYRRTYGKAPGPYSVYEYDAILVTANAIQHAKSTKPADIVSALGHLSGYKGATGEISFDEKGDRYNMRYMTIIVRDGAFESYRQRERHGTWSDSR